MQKNKNEKPFKSLIIKDKYKNYNDFYSENKTIIYKSILNIFKEFKTPINKAAIETNNKNGDIILVRLTVI